MNLPNALTIFRILALPFCAWALFKNGGDDSTWRVIAWVMFFIVGMTDVLDGKIARSRNQISSLGIILDPIADKAFIATALIGLSILDRIPWWVTFVILAREVSVTILRFMVIKREVFDKLKDKCPKYIHNMVDTNDNSNFGDEITEYFATSIDESKKLLSEDYHFCKLARDNGIKVWGAAWAQLSHTGTYEYSGRLV